MSFRSRDSTCGSSSSSFESTTIKRRFFEPFLAVAEGRSGAGTGEPGGTGCPGRAPGDCLRAAVGPLGYGGRLRGLEAGGRNGRGAGQAGGARALQKALPKSTGGQFGSGCTGVWRIRTGEVWLSSSAEMTKKRALKIGAAQSGFVLSSFCEVALFSSFLVWVSNRSHLAAEWFRRLWSA